MKNNNTTGIIIIVCVLALATMQAFDMSFNLDNLKIMGSIVVSVVIGLILLFGMKSKSHHDPHYYKDPDEEEKERLRYENQITPPEPIHVPVTPHHEEDNNRYASYHTPMPVEEDNRWS